MEHVQFRSVIDAELSLYLRTVFILRYVAVYCGTLSTAENELRVHEVKLRH